jgi:[acyl-carrier-protein] S-malonyltransferase
VQTMAARGVTRAVECGPGRVLSGLIKRIDKTIATDAIGSLQGLRTALGQE